ncbi:hypothetical protein BDA96_02G021800 [Sorghum bicolor]|uniref:Uncharacterized protein n=2 Tax=Sorghum bicolor TaxID=4558 RepID=A0A921RJI4_SORBI|nr:uncharacterized protein LOC8059894 [Sorghum bicolor]EER97910.1 hypothetical protein SORBI_3002G020800 [Sorghum bicolor]KAG0541499.1 hypothetical protein BDA96_02G021800 [Sorghum bicolor]|eukprot:XP_002461389.1 uncharacterized protein LOC8059894 [Sorghum bicolor]
MRRGAAAATTSGGTTKLAHHVSWLWRGPRRALCAARDLYVRSLTGCAGHLPADAAFGYPTFAGAAAAPSFGVHSGFGSASSSRRSSSADAADEDLRELIRAASQRRAAELERQRHPAAVPRSHSVAGGAAMARIDEDGPCDFASAAAAVVLFPRSRSCAPAGSGRVAGRRGGRVAALAA